MRDAYIKKGHRYEPIGALVPDELLTEGVWVVYRTRGSKSMCNAKYMDEIFQISKCSNLEKLTIAQRGHIEKMCDSAVSDLLGQRLTDYELVRRAVANVVNQLLDNSEQLKDNNNELERKTRSNRCF